MKSSVRAWIASGLLAWVTAFAQDRSLNPQYGLAHRVNTAAYIDEVLDADLGGGNSAGTGIEFDITYSAVHGGWYVSHGEAVITPGIDPTLEQWLQTLNGHLTGSAKFNQSFAALFVDIKTPNENSLATVMDLIRLYVPSDVAVIYALNDISNFDVDTTGYNALKAKGLRANEGVQGWIKDIAEVNRFYLIMKHDQIERNTVEHGHAANVDEDILNAINHSTYHHISDPYRFKKVFTWTQGLQSSMEDYVNPAHSHHTDGQLVGSATSEYLPHYDDLDDFDGAIAEFSGTQRKADRLDFHSFWERSGSDYVSGNLIYVNSSAAGSVKTGAKHSPFATVPTGIAATVNGARVVVTPGANYTGVSRIAKPLRLEKSATVGVARITN
jgi:hypothetical protein